MKEQGRKYFLPVVSSFICVPPFGRSGDLPVSTCVHKVPHARLGFCCLSFPSPFTWSHSTGLSYSSSYWSNSYLQWQRHEVEALQSSCYSTVWSDPLCRGAAAGMDSLLQGLILCKSGKQLWGLLLQQTCKQAYNQSHLQYKSKQKQQGSLGDHNTWVRLRAQFLTISCW